MVQLLNGNVNKLLPTDRAAHDWYRFVLSFPPHLVRHYLEQFGASEETTVLDPFCGTGTTLVECKKLGVPSVGIEANAMAYFASRVKTDWSASPEGLHRHGRSIADKTLEDLEREGIDDDAFFSTGSSRGLVGLRALPKEQESLLLRNSISPLPLHKSLSLRDRIPEKKSSVYADYERLALARALVGSISNLCFGPEVGVGKPKEDAPVVGPWLEGVQEMARDLRELKPNATTPCTVHHSDARELSSLLKKKSVDFVFTSPPYPNEKDYTRTTRLESVVLGFLRSKAELRAMKQGLIRSNTRNVYVTDDDEKWIAGHKGIQKIAEEIEKRRKAMGKTSGFERLYARVTKLYFGGMARQFAELRDVLRPGAMLGYVVGDQASYLRVMIRTGEILGNLAEELGYDVVALDLFRTRLATATREQLREEVLILRWPGGKT